MRISTKRKGTEVRPCPICGHPISHERWVERDKWHWVNPDKSHHRCSEMARDSDDKLRQINEDTLTMDLFDAG